MSNGQDKIIKRSARLFNIAAAAFYSFPEAEDGFVPEDKNTVKAYNLQRPYGPSPRFCFAPFSSMFFNTEGKALACCKNTQVVLGTYPDQQIKDMWQSTAAKKLRRYIDHNDLSNGCYKCRLALHSGNYGSMSSIGFDFLRAWPGEDYPRLLEFELSNVCNLECRMCSGRVSSSIRRHREGKEALQMPYDDAFCKQLEEFIPHLKQARFYGGEPFLIDIYYKIWEQIITINPKVNLYVLTNGTILNDRIRQLIDAGDFTIHVSFDSFNKETYENIRINANFEESLQNLNFFIAAMRRKKKRLCIYITPTRLNCREIPQIVDNCNKLDTDIYFSTAWYPEDLSLWNLPVEELEDLLSLYSKSNLPANSNRDRFEEMQSDMKYWVQQNKEGNSNQPFVSHFESLQEKDDDEYIRRSLSSVYFEQLIANFNTYSDRHVQEKDAAEIRNILVRIDTTIIKYKLVPAVIYFFLMGIKPDEIVKRMRNFNDDENGEYLVNKQEELLQKYKLSD